MDGNLEGKIALVTGAARGIGFRIASVLAERGASVIISDIADEESLQGAKEQVPAVAAYNCNVTDFEATQALMDTIIKTFGRLDILVNNAGITKDTLLMRMKESEFDAVIDVNLKGTFNCLRHASKYMIKQRSGAVVNIASVVGIMGNVGQCNYSASKAGVIGLTKSSAKELAMRGVRVNAVAPGFIETDMTKNLSQPIVDAMMARIPLKELGQPEDVARAVAFLVSEDARYITGQVLSVDGGMHM